MSVIVHGLHQGSVVLEDMTGEVHSIPLLWVSGIDEAIHAGEVAELNRCTFDADGRECDQAALTTDLRDKPVCYRHAPDDDKDA
jgi:hypothetical protein